MPLFSTSPHKRGTAEDFTYRVAEDTQERIAADPNAGTATMAVSRGLGHLLLAACKVPGLALRAVRLVLASGPVARWTVTAAVIASVLGLLLSLAMHDEIMRAQIRFVPVGAVLGFGLGLWRRAAA